MVYYIIISNAIVMAIICVLLWFASHCDPRVTIRHWTTQRCVVDSPPSPGLCCLGRLSSPGTPGITWDACHHSLFIYDDGLIQFSLKKVAQYIIIYILTSYFSFKARLLAYSNPYNITHRHFCVAARVGLLGAGRGCDPGVLLDQV